MKKVYIVRHGQTDTNSRDVVSGEHGTLSEKGKLQAHKLAERLQHIDFKHLLSSDYDRAIETAELIAKINKKELESTPLLRELRRPTEFHNKPRTSAEYLTFLNSLDENINNPNWHFSDEENFFDLVKRVKKVFANLEKLDGNIIVVCHSRIIMTMTLFVIMKKELTPDIWKIGMKNMHVSNTGITTFTYNKETEHWKLEMFNDQAHFAE